MGVIFLSLETSVTAREQPIFSTRAHVFQIDPNTKKNWVPTSKHAVTVSYFYDSTRNVYRIISLDGSKAIINSTITPNMTFTKTSQKFGQWADSRANTVYGLGFSSEHHLSKKSYTLFAEKFQEFKEAARLAKEKSQEKMELTSTPSQVYSRLKPKLPLSSRAMPYLILTGLMPSAELMLPEECNITLEFSKRTIKKEESAGGDLQSPLTPESINGTDDERTPDGIGLNIVEANIERPHCQAEKEEKINIRYYDPGMLYSHSQSNLLLKRPPKASLALQNNSKKKPKKQLVLSSGSLWNMIINQWKIVKSIMPFLGKQDTNKIALKELHEAAEYINSKDDGDSGDPWGALETQSPQALSIITSTFSDVKEAQVSGPDIIHHNILRRKILSKAQITKETDVTADMKAASPEDGTQVVLSQNWLLLRSQLRKKISAQIGKHQALLVSDRMGVIIGKYSSAISKHWEAELATLKGNNAKLTAALLESTANVKQWKQQLAAYQEEAERLHKRKRFACLLQNPKILGLLREIRVTELECVSSQANAVHTHKSELNQTIQELEETLKEKEEEIERLKQEIDNARELQEQRDSLTQKLQDF
ncbi:hypothetical protein P7K49_004926 [Saguinus oedipus]|uniref:WH1 domain-containing protein n=4 Tax=Amniota TaxID=32524 RepID=A0ABQ9W8T2_SAGOE|nr:hypothetical protein P7K49_004926 [Saguinus oedipus]